MKYAALWSQVVGLYTEGFTDAKSRPGEERHKNFVAWAYPCNDGLDLRLRKARPVLLHRVNDWHLTKFVVPFARVDVVAVFGYRRCEHELDYAGLGDDRLRCQSRLKQFFNDLFQGCVANVGEQCIPDGRE